jgi:SAM-dependent methyltransferase
VLSGFDPLAADYDRTFTQTVIGRLLREAVWSRCAAHFPPGSHVLEMNCGTGEDALWLAQQDIHVLATDISATMVQVAADKLAAAPVAARAQVRQLAWEQLSTLPEGGFDGALSNFGGLNCVGDLPAAARALADRLRPGAMALLCIMGPAVPWEWLWFLGRGDPRRAFRRLRRAGTQWRGIQVRYPSIGATRRAFAPGFRVHRVAALGALLPPPYTESLFARFGGLLKGLGSLERRLETLWPLPQLADHYLIELRRI